MRTGFESEAKKMTIKRKWHSRWVKAVTVLASVTVFCTTYALILPAITMSADTYCGHEEHKHDESCYERQLICVLEEGAEKELEVVSEEVTVVTKEQVLVDDGHTHEEACYETETVLICDIEEVEAKEAVVDEETGEVIEEAVEGHTHTDACYETVETLVCGEEEREAVYEEQEVETVETVEKEEVREVSGHKHTDECYESVLKCTIEEHEHEDMCFSNKDAVEEPSDWEKTLPEAKEMTKNPSEDIVLVAKTQVGYRESEANFVMVEGQRKGYTRYGAMFGKAYEDWNGMFVQFCMHYAGVNDKYMKGDTDIAKWIKEAQKKEIFFAADAEDFQVKAGDIVFFEKKVKEEKVNTIGIVEEVKEKNIIVIEGDDDNEVVRNKYNVEDKAEDKEIVGYAILPEKAEEVEEVVIEETVVETEEVAEEAVTEVAEEATAEEVVEEAPVAPNTGIAPEVRLAEATVIASFYTDDTYTEFANEGTAITISGELPVYKTINDDGEEVEDLAVVVKAYKVDAPQINETDAVLAYDITIFYKEGCAPEGSDGTFQPVTPVKVSFESDLLNAETVQGYGIYHIGDDGETEYCGGDNTALEEGVVSFDAHHFSPYMVSIIDSGIQNDSYGAYPEEENEDEEETVIEETFSISSVFQKIRLLNNSGQAINAYATKSGDTYTVTSWAALKNLIEFGKYKDGTGTKDATESPLKVVINGVIGANSTINTMGKTIELNGTNGASVYVCSTATSLSGGMFKVDGGSMDIENVKFSGQKATYTEGNNNTTPQVTTYTFNPKFIFDNAGSVTVELKNGHCYPKIDGKYIIYENGLQVSNRITNAMYLRTTTGGDLTSAPTQGGVYILYSPGGNGTGYYYYNSTVGSNMLSTNPSVEGIRKYTLTAVSTSGGGTSTPATWTAPAAEAAKTNVNNLVNTETQGFFITAENGAEVTIGDNTSFQDMIYDATTEDVAPNPIYVTGNDTEFNLVSDTATIKNNRSYIPALKNNNRKLLYKDVIQKAQDKNDATWDLNPGGRDYRTSHDDGTKASGGIFITDGGTVNLSNGTIGDDNAGNTGMAGAVYVDGGTLNQSGGYIKGNQALKGAVVVDGRGSTYNLTTGTVTRNDSTIHGGAISALNEGVVVIGDKSQTCSESSVPVISYNRTLDQGGGIYVHSDNVVLNKARIQNNAAHFMGGGIYVYGGDSAQDDKNSVLILDDAYITDNEASNYAFSGQPERFGFDNSTWGGQTYGEGGGIWSCTYGSFIMDGREIHIWDNRANSPGKDFYKHSKGNSSGIITEFIPDELDEYWDTKSSSDTNDDSRFDTSNFTPTNGRLSLVNKGNSASLNSEMDGMCDSVRITGNRAGYAGGGIGSNGIISYLPLNDKHIYQPELSFTKAFTNANTAGKTANFKVKIYNLTVDPNTAVETHEIQLSDDANVVNDPNGVDPVGYNVKGWTATIPLPQMMGADGNSVYAGLFNSASSSTIQGNKDAYTASYSIDNNIKVVIEEVSITGDALNSYELKLDPMGYTHSSRQLSNHQQDLKITYHTIDLVTTLTNEKQNCKGKIQLTKKDKDRDIVLSNPENQPEFRISAVDASNGLEDITGTEISGASGVYTTEYLDPGKYAIWESEAPTGYAGLGTDKYIYVTIGADGKPVFDSTTAQSSHVVVGNIIAGTSTDPTITDGGTLPITVYNDKDTNMTIAKVDQNGNPLKSTATKFAIKTFDGKTLNKEFTIDADDTDGLTNTFVFTNDDVDEFFETSRLNMSKSNFFLKEITPPSNRYSALDTVIPFRVRKGTGNNYQFVPMTFSELEEMVTEGKATKDSDGKTFTIEKTKDKIKFASTNPEGTAIIGVNVNSSEGSVTYEVKNEMKPIEIKVAKLDENGDPLPGATFTLRKAEDTTGNNKINQTANTPDNGIYTFKNTGNSTFLQTGKAYSIWEASAPNGYAPLNIGVVIEIDEQGAARLVSDLTELTTGKNSGRYRLDTTPEVLANAITNGTISVSDTVDENGVVTINIKNYPKTSIKVKKEWDSSVPNNLKNSVQVDLKANGTVVPGKRITLDSDHNWSGEWTDLPKYESHTHGDSCYDGDTLTCTKEALTLIDYTVEEVAGANNQFKVEYDFTDETVTNNCSNTGASTITGWQDVGIANLRGKNFRIVSNGKAYYVDDSGDLQTISTSNANVSDYYSKMLWTTHSYEHPSYYEYRVAFKHTAADGTDYHIAATNDYDRLTVRRDVPLLFYYYSYYKYMYWYDYGVAKYVDGTKTGNTYYNTVKFQIPIYENSQVCTDQINPKEWTITNSYDTVDLDFKKAWNDAGHESERPAYIDVELWVNNRKFEGKDLRVYGPNWTGKWENLPKYVDGVEAEYTAKEVTLNDHYTPKITTSTATGKEIIGWRKISHTALSDPGQKFRIIVNNKAYYLASNNTLQSTSKNSSSLYERMLWTAPYYNPTNVYYGTVYEVDIKLQSAYNPLYFIYNKPSANNNEAGTLLASTDASTYTYYVNANSIYYWVHNYTYGQWQYGFSGEVDPHCSAQVTFEEPIYGGTGNTELTITNTYHEHTGLELVKVDENGKSDQWVEEEGKQAQFTIYHMRGEIAPKTLTIENGKIFLNPIPTELVPKSGNSYFFIVETRTPTQENKPAYAKLETAIPIRISSSGEAYLITSASELNGTWFQNNYNSETKILPAAGSGNNARPAVKVDFGLIGNGKMVSASKDQKRITITAKNTPIDNEIELLKIDSSTSKPLGGATFEITKSGGGNVQNPARGDGNWTTADGTGILKIEDLAPGTYTIKEKQNGAPTGYQPDTNTTVTVVVDEYGKITATTNSANVVIDITGSGTTKVSFKFKNTPISYELPETGGIGTTVFALIGTILIMVAAVLLAVRRRLAREMR